MRSTRAAVAATVTLGALVLSSGTALADTKGKGRHERNSLKLVAIEVQSQFVDIGTPGPSLGDQFVFFEVLRKRGREVGTRGGVCVITEIVPPYTVFTVQCVSTVSLRRGRITLQGLLEAQDPADPGPFTVAVTGGTGAYRGAGGEAVIRGVRPGTRVLEIEFDSDHKKKHKRRH